MRTSPRQRGLSLAELLIGLSVGLLTSGLAVAVFLGQQRAVRGLDTRRQLTGVARDAMAEMETPLRRAGWGIDPRYALDERSYACTTPPCRDATGGPDQLVFVARNPYYQWFDNGTGGCTTAGGCLSGNGWLISATTTTQVTIAARAGDVFHQGRVVLASCTNGQNATMGTVQTKVTVAAAGNVTLTLVTAVAGNPYKENALTNACFSQPGASLFLVDRYRYGVMTFGGVPWLVFDNGMDNDGNGTTAEGGDVFEYVPIVPWVEDFQVAYLYNPGTGTAPDTNTNWIVGDNPASTLPEEPNPLLSAPLYSTALTDPLRFNLHPGNVRAVRLSLGLRSQRSDPSMGKTWPGDTFLATGNRSTALPAVTGGYHRMSTSTTVWLRNLESRSPFMF